MKKIVIQTLANADIKINGNRPHDIKVHDEKFFSEMFFRRSLGLGESYMKGWWDCERLDIMFSKLIPYLNSQRIRSTYWRQAASKILTGLLHINPQSVHRSKKVGKQHYDIGNELYEKMLDPYMQYTCAFFENTDTLAVAQEQKMERICQKLHLKEGERVLDIGCGWGGLAKYMAENYGVEVVGITISEEQAKGARDFTKGLPIEIRVSDYRDINDYFDKIVSVGMFEHVGYKNYETYMSAIKKWLKPDGLFLLHTIGRGVSGKSLADPWITKYIFPGGQLPSHSQICCASEGHLVIEDPGENFGGYYDITLMSWWKNFEKAYPNLNHEKYDETFYRMWKYYLHSCAGSFRSRSIHLYQVVFSHGNPGVYRAIR